MRIKQIIIVLLFLLLSFATTQALEINIGQSVKLKATNPSGVPLHRVAKSSMFDRLPDGTIVKVIEESGNNWLKVSSGTISGWIVKKYINEIIDASNSPTSTLSDEESQIEVWKDFSSCDSLVKLQKKLSKPEKTIRLATWNIRFFPQGNLYGNDPDKFTDQPWLACALAWLDADIIAVQEILNTPEANSALDNILDGLFGYNGGDWKVDLQECGSASSQHVGFIYNADKVTLSDTKDMWEFNGKASNNSKPCEGRLRPGRYGYVKSKAQNGFDFHLISVHTDSGKKTSDYTNRMTVVNRIGTVSQTLSSIDHDVVVIGDFNTMGVNNSSSSEELEEFKNKVSDLGFTDIQIKPECTEYYSGHGGWLDHVIVTKNTEELTTPNAIVQGYCNIADCERLSDMPAAYKKLSDHCPVIIDFVDQDID